MRKLFLVPLAVACTLVIAASASAAEVETIALFDFAASETPESIQVDRHGNIYVSLARTGEIRQNRPGRHPVDPGAPAAAPGDPALPEQPVGSAGDSRHRPRSPGQRLRWGEVVQRGRPRYLEGDARRPAVAGRQSAWRPFPGASPTASPTTTARSMSPIAPSRWSGGSTLTARAQRRSGPPIRCCSTRPTTARVSGAEWPADLP